VGVEGNRDPNSLNQADS